MLGLPGPNPHIQFIAGGCSHLALNLSLERLLPGSLQNQDVPQHFTNNILGAQSCQLDSRLICHDNGFVSHQEQRVVRRIPKYFEQRAEFGVFQDWRRGLRKDCNDTQGTTAATFNFHG